MELSVSNGVLRYTGGKEIEIIINNIVSKVYNDKKEKVILFMTDGTWTEFDLADITSPTFTLFSDMTEWFEDNVIPEIGGGAAVYTQNVAYINAGIDDSDNRIFETYKEAVTWITANGSPTAKNQWSVLTSGYLDEDIELVEFINLDGYIGSSVKSVVSTTDYANSNIFNIDVKNLTIETLYVAEGKKVSLNDCIINNVVPVADDGNGYLYLRDCSVFGGDFSNTLGIGEWERVQFIARVDNITDLSHIGTNIVARCHFVSAPSSYDGFIISDLPHILLYATGSFESLTLESAVVLFDSSILVEDLTVSAQLNVDGSYIHTTSFKITSNITKLTNSKVLGVITLTNAAEIKTTNSVINNNIQLNDTSTATIKQGTVLLGTITQVDPTTTITDERYVVLQFVDNAAASAAGLVVGSMYWDTTSSAIKIVTA